MVAKQWACKDVGRVLLNNCKDVDRVRLGLNNFRLAGQSVLRTRDIGSSFYDLPVTSVVSSFRCTHRAHQCHSMLVKFVTPGFFLQSDLSDHLPMSDYLSSVKSSA